MMTFLSSYCFPDSVHRWNGPFTTRDEAGELRVRDVVREDLRKYGGYRAKPAEGKPYFRAVGSFELDAIVASAQIHVQGGES